jgi:hypothetical protein
MIVTGMMRKIYLAVQHTGYNISVLWCGVIGANSLVGALILLHHFIAVRLRKPFIGGCTKTLIVVVFVVHVDFAFIVTRSACLMLPNLGFR